jgi:hypothetical protein
MEEDIPVWVLRPSTVEALATQLNPRKILLSESGTGRGWGDARLARRRRLAQSNGVAVQESCGTGGESWNCPACKGSWFGCFYLCTEDLRPLVHIMHISWISFL